MRRKIIFTLSLLASITLTTQAQNLNFKLLSASSSTENNGFTLGDIILEDQAGFLANSSIQLFSDTYVNIESLEEEDIKVFPNPTQNTFQIHSSQEIKDAKMYALDGTQLNIVIKHNTIDLSGFDPGFYLLRINNQKVLKIIKQ